MKGLLFGLNSVPKICKGFLLGYKIQLIGRDMINNIDNSDKAYFIYRALAMRFAVSIIHCGVTGVPAKLIKDIESRSCNSS